MAGDVEYDDGYCFRCCAEYGTNEPCPECDCFYYEYYFGDEEWWDEEEEF